MKTIFETCSPREEVLAGQIKEEIFMARLKDVIDGSSDAVYQDATTFEADIVSPLKGSAAHAETIDEKWVQIGKPPYANRVATTIFLHSLTQGVASGVAPAEMSLAVLQPEVDPAMIDRATESLIDDCWFLAWDGHRYRFTPEPQLPKVISDEMSLIGKVKAKEELDRRIRQIWKKGAFQPVYFPSEASEVDDDAQIPKLVVLHYDAATIDATTEQPPELVRKIFEHSGTLEGYRTYKNNLLFLVADNAQVERMVEVAQRYLAINCILGFFAYPRERVYFRKYDVRFCVPLVIQNYLFCIIITAKEL